jgi:hypothetical protein
MAFPSMFLLLMVRSVDGWVLIKTYLKLTLPPLLFAVSCIKVDKKSWYTVKRTFPILREQPSDTQRPPALSQVDRDVGGGILSERKMPHMEKMEWKTVSHCETGLCRSALIGDWGCCRSGSVSFREIPISTQIVHCTIWSCWNITMCTEDLFENYSGKKLEGFNSLLKICATEIWITRHKQLESQQQNWHSTNSISCIH